MLKPDRFCRTGSVHRRLRKTEKMEDADAVLVRSAAIMIWSCRMVCMQLHVPVPVSTTFRWINVQKKVSLYLTHRGANANGVKELVIAGMLLASRDIIGGVEWAKSEAGSEDIAKRQKKKEEICRMRTDGQKLGIIGLGAIGIQVANVAECLGMDVYGYDPYISVDAAWKLSKA